MNVRFYLPDIGFLPQTPERFSQGLVTAFAPSAALFKRGIPLLFPSLSYNLMLFYHIGVKMSIADKKKISIFVCADARLTKAGGYATMIEPDLSGVMEETRIMQRYLFDFDGTLVDSMPTYGALMLRILDEHGIAYGEDIIRVITPLGFVGTADHFIGMGLDRPREELVALMTAYAVDAYTHRVPAKPHVVEVLRALKQRGDSLNVLTASPHDTLDPCLKRLGIFDLFDHVWSCNDFGTTKSDPEIYRMAAERMGASVSDDIFR
jgi:HAD superfamily hydrolase (TIGR01509 family)